MRKRILVLMSTYNGEKYISQQIESILKQDCEYEIKLKIRDDGSCDNTLKLIRNYVSTYPESIELIEGKNVGVNASFFNLIQNSFGYDFYSLSDQDDVWLPNKLQVAIDWLLQEKQEIPLLYASTSYLVHDDLKPYGTTRKKLREFSIYNTIIQNICPGHTQVFNNALLNLLKKDIDVSKIYVYDSWITNIAMLYGKILFNNDSFTYYRQHRENKLGYGKGWLGRILTSIKHSYNGDGKKYLFQIKYFINENQKTLTEQNSYCELKRFVLSEKLWQRILFLFQSKLYRQSKLETVAFIVATLSRSF